MLTNTRSRMAVALSFFLLLAACGSTAESTTTTEPTPAPQAVEDTADEPVGEEAVEEAMEEEADDHDAEGHGADEEPAADGVILAAGELRATLTSTLQEHVFLSGIAVEAIADAEGNMDDPDVVGALVALDENSVAASGLIGAAAGPDEAAAFLAIWREHVDFFMNYAQGSVLDDDAAKQTALADLDGYRSASGAFFERITGGALPADAVAENFAGHVGTLTQAFDSIAADDPEAWTHLRHAAGHMKGTSLALATGFSTALPDAFPGDVADAEAETLTTITFILGEHVYLSGISYEQLAEADGNVDAPEFTSAFAALDDNSIDLAAVIGSLAPDEQEGFLALWREHVGFFRDYSLASIDGDSDGQAVALAGLDGYRSASGAFFDRLTGGALPAAAVEANFEGHVNTLNTAIEGFASDAPDAWSSLRTAARHMPGTAAALTAGVFS